MFFLRVGREKLALQDETKQEKKPAQHNTRPRSVAETLVAGHGSKLEYRRLQAHTHAEKTKRRTPRSKRKCGTTRRTEPKHVMLVTSARNALAASANTDRLKSSRSDVRRAYSPRNAPGLRFRRRLRPELDAVDALAASFPAGTLSAQSASHADHRINWSQQGGGVYGGPFSMSDCRRKSGFLHSDSTLLMKGKKAYLQAGAGIVADSDRSASSKSRKQVAGSLAASVEIAEDNV